MTPSPAWHVRVEHAGEVLGAGFLVSADTVLTCAHVVQEVEHVTLRFPGAQGLGELAARVAVRGPWGGRPTDVGDVAVLALDRPVAVQPVAFAEPDGAREVHEPPRLVAYGFPDGYGWEGAQTELRVTAAGQLIHDEWNQAEYWSGQGQEPSYGFSGSAAMRAADGTVVGMVASYDPAVRNARIIPARVLARHVPALADLVPTPGCSAGEKRRLRELVELAERAGPLPVPVERLLLAAAGRLGLVPPATAPAGLWQGVWHLLTESPPTAGRVPLAELAVRIADVVTDGELRRAFRSWAREHRARHEVPTPFPALPYEDEPRHEAAPDASHGSARDRDSAAVDGPGARLPWAPILVEVRRSGADGSTVIAEVSVYRGGARVLVSERRVTAGRLRGWVLDRIDEAYEEITDGRPLIAFALPRSWLNKDVDQWTRRRGKEPPLGCSSPVVVLDHDRRSKGRQQFALKRVWEELDRQDGSPLHRVACSTSQGAAQLSVLLQDVRGPVGFSRPPTASRERTLYGAALDAPAPIVLWPRNGCPPGGPCTGGCAGTGFLDRIAERISRLPPGELPDVVFRLRKEAFLHEGPEPHWAAQVSLVWEDPRRFPDVRPLSHSPVG
ncbi:trypsin-like peptidase domain-containing protein [Streptomyces sp. NPDC059071]|uniref:VMAP-C domain-containing protein n=1 Tax=unclassified Streptomyces TaxID=2593676 RepID=UPI0036687AC9